MRISKLKFESLAGLKLFEDLVADAIDN